MSEKRVTHKYTDEQNQFIIDNYKDLTDEQLLKAFNDEFGLNLRLTQILRKRYNMGLKKHRYKRVREYALYEGDELLAMGTIDEIADELNLSPNTVKYYGASTYHKRTNPLTSKRLYHIGDNLDDEEVVTS